MADVILFHHAQGLTDGVRRFADRLTSAGHRVTLPDLFDGATFPTVEDGVAHAQSIGFGEIIERGVRAADGLPASTVYAGFSMGCLPAQQLAQTRPGALGALLIHSAIPLGEFAPSWPDGVALQMHLIDGDPWSEEDRPAAEQLAAVVEGAELYWYPYSGGHLVCDDSLPDHDPEVAAQMLERSLAFLDRRR